MPTSEEDYNAERIRILLDDLWNQTRREAGFVHLESPSLPRSRVKGTATRVGLVHLGVELAREALCQESESICVSDDGRVIPADNYGVIDILLADESAIEQPERNVLQGFVGCAVTLVVIASTLALAAIGLKTVLAWITDA